MSFQGQQNLLNATIRLEGIKIIRIYIMNFSKAIYTDLPFIYVMYTVNTH